MKRQSILLTTLSFLIFFAYLNTANGQIYSDRDLTVDLNKYKTYAWIAPGDSILNRYRNDKVYGGFIVHCANLELKSKGMLADTIRPNAIFIFNTHVQEKTKYSQSPTLSMGVAVAGPGYYAGGMAPIAGGEITATAYQDGALSFNMYDAKTGKLLWTGGDRKKFTYADDIQKIISVSTKKIFKKLPVKHKKKK